VLGTVPVGDSSATDEPAAVAKARTPHVVVSHQLPITNPAHPAGAKKKHKGGSPGSGKPAHEQAPSASDESSKQDIGSLLPADLPPVELPPVELPAPLPSVQVPPPPPLPQVPDLPPLPSLTS
jgi:hypothetical protein